MNPQFRIALSLFAWLGMVGTASIARSEEDPLPLERQPYRVCLSVVFASEPVFTADGKTDLLAELRDAAERSFGGMAEFQIEENRRLYPASALGLERLTVERAGKEVPENCDKVLLLVLEHEQAHYRLTAREYDVGTRNLSELLRAETFDRRALATVGMTLARSLFRPVLRVDEEVASHVKMTLQAGELKPSDPDFNPLPEEAVMVPVLCYFDHEDVLQQVQQIPLTYLLNAERDGGRVTAAAVSGLRIALAGKRRRVETRALVEQRRHPSSQVQFVSRNSASPLAGQRVLAYSKTFVHEETEAPPLRLLTSRQGEITVPVQPEHPVVWLYVSSGSVLVARVPYLPGLEHHSRIEIPDDTLRLAAEGELKTLEIELIDTVARRSVLILRATRFADEEDWKRVDLVLAEIDALPKQPHFAQRLNTIREQFLKAAMAQGNTIAASQIRAACEQLAILIEKHMTEQPVRDLKDQVKQLRKS